MDKKEQDSVILEASLQTFFFDELDKVNQKSLNPVSREKIFYSSLIMDKYSLSEHFFEKEDGKVRDKILGIKLLEASHMTANKKKQVVKDVAETSLFLCGFFSDSLNRKIVDVGYYRDIGQSAYQMLNNLIPSFYEIDSFYKSVSNQFDTLASLIRIVRENSHNEMQEVSLFIGDGKKVS